MSPEKKTGKANAIGSFAIFNLGLGALAPKNGVETERKRLLSYASCLKRVNSIPYIPLRDFSGTDDLIRYH